MMKSSMSLLGNAMRPCTMSSHAVVPSGTRKRIANDSPRATRRSCSSRESSADWRSNRNASPARLGCAALAIQFLGRGEVPIGGATFQERTRIALVLGKVSALMGDVFIPVEAEPAQPVKDRLCALCRAASTIGVLDA